MNQYRANDGDRLDIIVFKNYGSIDRYVMDIVLDANEHLLGNTILKAGDVVFLPEITTTTQETTTKALW